MEQFHCTDFYIDFKGFEALDIAVLINKEIVLSFMFLVGEKSLRLVYFPEACCIDKRSRSL